MSTTARLSDALALLIEHRDSIEDSNRDPTTGRVHDVDALEFIQQHDEACAAIRDAITQLQIERSQHDTDSRELRRLCAERDAARRSVDKMAMLRSTPRSAPVLEVRACGCSQAKAGRCVMGDYGALPIGTQLYAGPAPVQTEPLTEDPKIGISKPGEREALLSQARTELRRCPQLTPEGVEAFSVCVAAALAARPCYCGPEGCSDSTACPKGGAA